MGDFLGMLIIFVIYMSVAAAGNKKKKAKNEKQRAARSRDTAFEQAFSGAKRENAQGRMPGSHMRTSHVTDEGKPLADCASSRIHLHETTQQQMHMAGEGEDPCHAGSAPSMPEPPAFSYDEEHTERIDFAQDMVRGVIMSEILTRPCDRAAIRRNGRR